MQNTFPGIHRTLEIGFSYTDHTFGSISRFSLSVWTRRHLSHCSWNTSAWLWVTVWAVCVMTSCCFLTVYPCCPCHIIIVSCDSNCRLLSRTPTLDFFHLEPLAGCNLYLDIRSAGAQEKGAQPIERKKTPKCSCLFITFEHLFFYFFPLTPLGSKT